MVLELPEDEQSLKGPSTPVKKRSRAKEKAPLTEDELRRSSRLKKKNNGFKASVCNDKNCLGCSATPPTISTKVIRNLGADFCDLDPAGLSPSKLNAPTQKKKDVKSTQDLSPSKLNAHLRRRKLHSLQAKKL